jgi:pimeloyl-ACP methyl ester carboxylesterase
MAQALCNGINIEYEVHGSGEPLLLIMGLGGQLVSWPIGFVDGLVSEGFQVIIFDNRDIGLSTKMTTAPLSTKELMASMVAPKKTRTDYYLADMAKDSVALLDHLGIDSAHIVGMSMGGMIAQSIAIDHPLRVRSLTSIMSTTGNRRVGRIATKILPKITRLSNASRDSHVENEVKLFSLISGDSFDPAEIRSTSQRGLDRSYCPDGVKRQTAAIFASPDRTEMLRKLMIPSLVVHGLGDKLVQPSGGMATAAAIPNSRLLMFPEMGHNLPPARWSEMFTAIRANANRGANLVHV